MYSSGVYHLNRSGIVESIDKNIIVVRLDKLNEQDEDFKNVDTLQLDCRNCGYELENLKEGKKIIFYYFPYNADVRPLKVENIYVINEKDSNIDFTKIGWVRKVSKLFNFSHTHTKRWIKKNYPEILDGAYIRKIVK